ncbi:MAG: porin family protein, partial [Hyphomicrobiales bacterium]|nr:porin family protein [Hyphomicrobiales bacterium]
WTSIGGSKSASFVVTEGTGVGTLSMRNSWQASLRANVGFAADRFQIYGTGGVAFADDRENVYLKTTSTFTGSQTRTLTGWTLGLGAKYAIDRNWNVGAEVRYAGFGKGRYSATNGGTTYDYSAGFSETLATLTLAYKF